MKRRQRTLSATIVALTFACAAFAREAAPSLLTPARKTVTVGLSQIGAESSWRKAETRSIQDEAASRGIDLKYSDAQLQQENQIKALRWFIAHKVDAIILAPVVSKGWEPVLKEARAAGIPVFLADRAVEVQDPNLYVTLVSPDAVEEGRMAGRWMAKALNGKGNVVELKGSAGTSYANDRERGFHEVLAQYPDLMIIASRRGDFTRGSGKAAMEAILHSAAGTKINALYAHNDDMALGAIQAIQQAGLKPGVDIKVVSVDAVREAFVAMAAGRLNCTVECSPMLGPALFDAIEAHLSGHTVPKMISPKERTYEAAEAKSLLPTRKY